MSKRGLVRDEPTLQSFRGIDDPPGGRRGDKMERSPSEMMKDDIDHPIVQCESFQPCVDDFMKNGPSADMDKLKDLAAEIASQHSNVDPRSLSKSLSSFGRLPSDMGSATFMNDASIQSFSSLVEFENPNKRNHSWQESVKDLISNQTMDELMHKEYKMHETSKEHKLSSKDWDINVSMESMLMQPFQKTSANGTPPIDASDVTNNIVTSVNMNQDQSNERKHSVDIRSVAIGRDTGGRMASYEMFKTTFALTPTSMSSFGASTPGSGFKDTPPGGMAMNKLAISDKRDFSQNSMNLDPVDLEPTPINLNPNLYASMAPGQQQITPQQMASMPPPANVMPQQMMIPQQMISMGHQPQMQMHGMHPPPPKPHGFIVPPKSHIKLNNETGNIDVQAIKDDDVLLERGGKGNHHKGSRYYRRLINERRRSYQDLPDAARAEKMNISLSIVLSLKASGARFIHKKAGMYMVMSDREARNKISQALREKKERVMLD